MKKLNRCNGVDAFYCFFDVAGAGEIGSGGGGTLSPSVAAAAFFLPRSKSITFHCGARAEFD